MKKLSALLVLLLSSPLAYSDVAEGSVIGNLATREYIVEIWSIADAPMYVVKDRNGAVLTKPLSVTDLSAVYPRLGALVNRGVANDESLTPNASDSVDTGNLIYCCL